MSLCMKYFSKIFFHLISIAVLGLLYFNLVVWSKMWLGIFLTIVFFWLNGSLWQKIFGLVFGMSHNDFIAKFYAWFAVFLLLSFVSSVWVVWYKINPEIIWAVFVITQLVGEGIGLLVARAETGHNFPYKASGYKYCLPESTVIRKHVMYIIAFLILWLSSLFLLSKNIGVEVLNSPWQIINQYYIVSFFFLTLVLFFICLSRHKVKLIVFFLILHSLLLHIYLPASHKLPWGGDVWRHIAIENKLMSGEEYLPVLFGPEAKWREVANIDLPEALLIPNKYFYGQLWGSSILTSFVLGLDIVFVNIWLMPILWGVMIPIIMFRLGRLLYGSWRSGLLLALFVSAFYPFQALGGLTLPVSLGYLTMFFVLMLWLQYLRDGKSAQRNIVFLFAFLMMFGYTLNFVLVWLIIGISLLIQYNLKQSTTAKNFFRNNFFRLGSSTIIIGVLLLFFPILEYLLHSSYFSSSVFTVSKLTQILGQFSGWYFVSAIRPHDILTGNIIFNHTPDYAFVSSLFMDNRWPIILFVGVVYITVLIGLFLRSKNNNSISFQVSQYLFLSVGSGYLLSWFFMVGEHSLVRRLDAMLSYLLIIFSLLGIFILFKKLRSNNFHKIGIVILGLIFSWTTAITYASGPDMRVVSESEYKLASYLWDNIKDDDIENVCVIADTWPLLILEGLSSQKIVGGGFPIDTQFGQPERVELFGGVQDMKVENLLEKAHSFSNKTKCFITLPIDKTNIDIEKYISDEFNDDGELVGDFIVWKEVSRATSTTVDETSLKKKSF